MLFLSAMVKNSSELADWIEQFNRIGGVSPIDLPNGSLLDKPEGFLDIDVKKT